jgi:rhamnosyltransferase
MLERTRSPVDEDHTQFGNRPACFVAAVIVTYNCYTAIERTILAAADQVCRVIIVDNGSEPETLNAIKNAIDHNRLQSCDFLPQDRNLGIGAALNVGVRAALAAGAEYVLTLDDDTEIFPGAVAELVRCCVDHEGQHVGIVGALWICHQALNQHAECFTLNTFPETRCGKEDAPRSVERLPSSGCLIRREAFEAVGMFREDYFLDHTDYEYCARIIDAGWRVLICPTATVFHRPADMIVRPFFGWSVVVTNYPAERLFFLCRNGFVLYLWERRSGRHLRQHFRAVAVTFVKSLLYEREKARKSSAIIRGSVEGLLGHLGPPSRRDGDRRIRRLDRI